MTHTQTRSHWPSNHCAAAHWAAHHWFALTETIDEHSPFAAGTGSFATLVGLAGDLAAAAQTGSFTPDVPLTASWPL
jgi:hypothetical protein